ncbi:MAG TPA: DUF4232 domain-containing protein [Streptosporangiaceae bacterium]
MACAAILLPATALAAPGHPAAPAAAAAPKCALSDLSVWLGIPGDSAAGSTFYQLEMSNISKHSCTLIGFPGVSAVGLGGHQLGSAATRDHSDPKHLVTLGTGGTAHAVLQIVDAGVFQPSACHPKNAIGLRVFPPNDARSEVIGFTFKACQTKGPKFLSVRVTRAGTGIPNFSH